jgi:predicted DNA-binding transcriptional regulator AlpA
MRMLFQKGRNMQTRTIVERLLSKKQVREIVGLSYAQMARLENAKPPKFPKRIRLTDHPRGRCAYAESEIVAWVAERIALRSKQPQ